MVNLVDRHRFPVVVVVALQAVLPQAALVVVFMASAAGWRYTQVGSLQILDFNDRAFALRNVLRTVTLGAGQTCVLAFQHVARLLVIEAVDVPLDQREVLPVVIGVAAGTILAGTGFDVVRSMQALLRGDP